MRRGQLKYNKLIRDEIPALIELSGDKAPFDIEVIAEEMDLPQFKTKLVEKLKEEVGEFVAAYTVDEVPIGELVDILEVVYAIGEVEGIPPERLEDYRRLKVADRGAFKKRLLLIETRKREPVAKGG